MKDYSEISDAELSAEVLKIKYGAIGVIALYETGAKLITNEVTHKFDINNPSDMWPLIVESKITIEPESTPIFDKHTGHWIATDFYIHFQCKDKNPLRAAAIVFLMINED